MPRPWLLVVLYRLVIVALPPLAGCSTTNPSFAFESETRAGTDPASSGVAANTTTGTSTDAVTGSGSGSAATASTLPPDTSTLTMDTTGVTAGTASTSGLETGGTTSGPETGGTTSGLETAGTAAGSETGGTTFAPENCLDPSLYPDVDKDCVTVQDCALVDTQINCCGSMKTFGIDADDVDAFQKFAQECAALFPACGCPLEPTIAEDEKSGKIVVVCTEGQCFSKVIM